MVDALIVNPYDTEECARALHHALTMDPQVRHRRMARLRDLVAHRNVYQWAGHFMAEIHRIAGLQDVSAGGRPRTLMLPHARSTWREGAIWASESPNASCK